MNLIFRQEEEQDFPTIENLVKMSFKDLPDADGDEHEWVNELRKTKDYIPELSLVVLDNQNIIGHILLTRTYLTSNQEEKEALLLSPICVQAKFRSKGIGSQLIFLGLEKARKLGFKAVFLVGRPEFYLKFGFISIQDFGIKNRNEIPLEFCLGLELEKGYLRKAGGLVSIT